MQGRRNLLLGAAAAGATLALGCHEARPPGEPAPESPRRTEDVGPTEDLMREHGVLQRVLLVYDECARRLESTGDPPPANVLPAAAKLVREFVHDYHEKMEEDAVFPRCEHGLVHVALVRTLRDQHVVGRKITAFVEQASPKERKKTAAALRAFARMYRAHASREDTILFPAFRDILRPGDLDALGERFEAKERELFGEDGFERKVAEVAEIESALDLNDLARLTPGDFK
jgi:hemerythrin-like domain-containing protein